MRFGDSVAVFGAGQLDVSSIITKKIKLDEIVSEGFETLVNDKTQAKILVTLSGDM